MAYNTFNPIIYKGLVLYLDAENLKSYSGSGLNWYDLTSNGNNGVLTNGATFSLSGNSIQFDGINDYVNIPYSPVFNIQRFTLSVWVRFSSFESFNSLITNPQTGNISGSWFNPYLSWMLRVNSNNEIEVGIGSNSTYYNSNFSYTFTTNEVYNIVVTYDESTVIVYVNSVKIGQNSVSTTINYTSKPVIIGSDYGEGFSNCFIYNTQIYNRDLSLSEVLQNYNATKWRFINELPTIVTDQLILNLDAGDTSSYPGSGTTWYDLTVNNNDGVLTNGVTYDSVVGDGSMIFDGVNDFVNLGTSVGKLVQFTISVWLKPDNWNNCGIVFSSNTGGGQGSTHWGLWGRVSGNMEIFVSNGSSYQSANTSLPWSSSDIPNSSFTNIVITVDGSNIRIFKNSIQIGSDIAQTISQSGTAYDLCVGKNPADSGYFYDGYISDVLVYSKSLTSTEVLQNFNAQKNRYGL